MQIVVLLIGAGCVRAGGIEQPAVPAPLPESLSARQLSAAVEANRPALQRCYEEWLTQHPLRRDVVFELSAAVTIRPDGGAQSVELDGVDDQRKLAGCIRHVLASWHYPRSVHGAEFVAPLLLAGREPAVATGQAPGEALPLTPRQLRAAMVANKPSLKPCFEEWLRGHPDLPKLVASVTIDPDGSTRAAQLRGTDPPPMLKSCIREALLAWKFPRSGRPAEFAFPLSFN